MPIPRRVRPNDPDDGNCALLLVPPVDSPGAAAGDARHLLDA
jgi:hypothetical protein